MGCMLAGASWGDRYVVRNRNDTGPGSLRWAIRQANKRVGRDVIAFAPRLSGKRIYPQSALPTISDNRTVVDGDTDDDGQPDICINGRDAGATDGIEVVGVRYCRITGLAVVNFDYSGINLHEADYTTVTSCHVGVNLAGDRAVPNGSDGIRVCLSGYCTIGGAAPGEGNVVVVVTPFGPYSIGAVKVADSDRNTVAGNRIGLSRDGTSVLGTGGCGIWVRQADNNVIGGTTAGARNLFGGLDEGVRFWKAAHNTIRGNWFGLRADGRTLAPIAENCIRVEYSAASNTIGGTETGARNVFAGGAHTAVLMEDEDTAGNIVRGNYFGLTADGTRQRRLGVGVWVRSEAGRQIIGGSAPVAGNYFAPKADLESAGVVLSLAGDGTLIRHNRFGVRPDGRDASLAGWGCLVDGVSPEIADNVFAGEGFGIMARYASANPLVVRNTFRRAAYAVAIMGASRCRLGNLSNANSSDDGGNIFRPSNTWYIHNQSSNRIRAEGNRFPTTVFGAIHLKIHDRRDDPAVGRVDIDPLIGGIAPTGDSERPLTLCGTTAAPTPSGAQITFKLSAAAQVQARILNIAGRPVTTLCRATECEAGTNTLLWNGLSDSGLPVPNGTYVVQVTALSENGQQAEGLCVLKMTR
jgi:hypothetical protein